MGTSRASVTPTQSPRESEPHHAFSSLPGSGLAALAAAYVGVALRDLPGRHVNARSHVTAVLVVLCGRCFLLGLGVVTAFLSPSLASAMEEEDEEARALLAGGPDEADRGAPAVPGALPALCDPSRLAHRLLVLLLMCFLGFGEPAGWVGADL